MKQILSVMGCTVKNFGISAVNQIRPVVANPRFAAVMMLLVIVTTSALAQDIDSGVQAITQSTDALKKYIPVITKLCYVLAGIVGILGTVSVFIKMNNEEQDVKKSIMMIVGSCIFLLAAAQALPLFFGL